MSLFALSMLLLFAQRSVAVDQDIHSSSHNQCWVGSSLYALHHMRYTFWFIDYHEPKQVDALASSISLFISFVKHGAVKDTDFVQDYMTTYIMNTSGDEDTHATNSLSFLNELYSENECIQSRAEGYASFPSSAIWDYYHSLLGSYAEACDVASTKSLCTEFSNDSILASLKSVVDEIFTCRECQKHFGEYYKKYTSEFGHDDLKEYLRSIPEIPSSHHGQLWLWRMHNAVNIRTKLENCFTSLSDLSEPKCQFASEPEGHCLDSTWLMINDFNQCNSLDTIDPVYPMKKDFERGGLYLDSVRDKCSLTLDHACSLEVFDVLQYPDLLKQDISGFLMRIDAYLTKRFSLVFSD